MSIFDPEKNQIVPVGSSQVSVRSGNLALRGLRDLELLHKNKSVSTAFRGTEENGAEGAIPKHLKALIRDPKVFDILIMFGEEYLNNGVEDRGQWHSAIYNESENIAKGLGDVLEPLFPDIWEAITDETDYIGGVKGIYGERVDNVDEFKPDYGLRLLQDGVSRNANLHFYSFRLYSIKILGSGQFTTMVEMPYAGKLHALSLDFNRAQLDEILLKAPSQLRDYVKGELLADPGTPRTIHLKGCICFGVRARMGKVEKAPKEYFVPLIAQDIFDA